MDSNAMVYVVDDDPTARDSVLARAKMRNVPARGFASAEEFLAEYDKSMSGCAVFDVKLAGMNGVELLQTLRAQGATLPIIIITGYGTIPLAVKAMQAGAFSFLEKPGQQENELWDAIERALQEGEEQQASQKQQQEIEARLKTLTPDERQVLDRLLEGMPNKRIASELDIGLRTVELRRSNIMKKMNAGSLAEMVRMALIAGVLKPIT